MVWYVLWSKVAEGNTTQCTLKSKGLRYMQWGVILWMDFRITSYVRPLDCYVPWGNIANATKQAIVCSRGKFLLWKIDPHMQRVKCREQFATSESVKIISIRCEPVWQRISHHYGTRLTNIRLYQRFFKSVPYFHIIFLSHAIAVSY